MLSITNYVLAMAVVTGLSTHDKAYLVDNVDLPGILCDSLHTRSGQAHSML